MIFLCPFWTQTRVVFLPALTLLIAGCFDLLVAQPRLSLDQAVERALVNHPQLKAAKSEIAIAQAKLIDAGKLENPFLEFEIASQLKDGPDREGAMFVGYSQAFPVTDKLLRQRQLSIVEVQLACAEVREIERAFIARVQEAYIRALGAKALVAEMSHIESSTQKSIDLSRSQVAVALGSELDVAAAETELVLVAQDRVVAEGSYRQALAALRPLLSMAPAELLVLADSLPAVIARLDAAIDIGKSSRSVRTDIIAAQMNKERALADQKLAQSEKMEDWELNAGYEASRSVDEPIGVERERLLSLGVKIPLPVRKRGAGRIAEAQARSEQADHEIAIATAAQQSEAAAALAEMHAARATTDFLKGRVLPQLKDRESNTWRAYREGLADFNQIIVLQQQQTRTHKAITQSRLDLALALIRLQSAQGSHPSLQAYNNASECPSYRPGTEASEEPWVFTDTKLGKVIQAVPVVQRKVDHERKNVLKQIGMQLFR